MGTIKAIAMIAISRIKQLGKWLYVIPLLAIIITFIVIKFLRKVKNTDPVDTKTDNMVNQIRTLTNKIVEANHQATIEVAVARTKDQEIKNRLNQTLKIENEEERLKNLIALRYEVEK